MLSYVKRKIVKDGIEAEGKGRRKKKVIAASPINWKLIKAFI